MDLEKAIESVASQYRSEGYQVAVHPNASQAPPFAAGLLVDLLATRGDEHVVVLVKESAEALRKDPQSLRIAEAVNAQPGWRFDVVVLNGSSRTERLAREAAEPSVDAILRNLEHAERTAQAGDPSTSFILAWASLEAAMRRTVRASGLELPNISPIFLLRTLYSNGLLEREEFDRLNGYFGLRNSVVHGLEAPPIDSEPILYIVGAARKLLERVGQEKSPQ
jgi:uncharacterized protein YutE (UPF0331/DUF86 family)